MFVFILVAIEAAIVLGPVGLASAPVLGQDGRDYDVLARNLAERGAFSLNTVPPFEPTMYRSPGYPLFLAAVYLVFGKSLLAVRVSQFFILAGTACGVYFLGRRVASDSASVVAAVLCATYPPFVFMCAYQLSEIVAGGVAVLFLLLLHSLSTHSTAHPWLGFFCGLVFGYGVLVRTFTALMILIALVLILGVGRHMRSAQLKSAIAFLCGSMVVLAPWGVRNVALARSFVPLGTTAGVNSWSSAMMYRGVISYRLSAADWKVLIDEGNSQRAVAARYVDEHPDPRVPRTIATEVLWDRRMAEMARNEFSKLTFWQWLGALPVRARFLWGASDWSPWQAESTFHRFVQAEYSFLLLLVLAGLFISGRLVVRQWPLWLYAVYISALFVPLFFVEARETFPARGPLFVYAGLALSSLGRRLQKKSLVRN